MALEAVEDGHPTHVSFALAQEPGLEERARARPRLNFRLLANSVACEHAYTCTGGSLCFDQCIKCILLQLGVSLLWQCLEDVVQCAIELV